MAFDKEILREIHNEFTARRVRAEAKAEERRAYIYEKFPRIREIEEQLRLTPIQIAKAAFLNREDATPRLEEVKAQNLKLQAERAELLVANGFGIDYLEPQYNCKKCEDNGYINPGEPCECLIEEYKKAQIKKLRDTCGFEVNSIASVNLNYYSKEKGENPCSPYEVMEVNLGVCQNYIKTFGDGKSLFLSGGTGVGKTYLASCIALEVAAKGYSIVYGTAFEILGEFEDKKFNREMSVDRTEDYKKADLLIIDDLGAEMITQFSTAALYNLMSIRESASKSTIIISTLSVNEIANKYTPQIASRIGGKYLQLVLVGEDIRKKARE